MKVFVVFAAGVLASALFALPASADAPLRHLVFRYSYGVVTNTTVHNSGFNDSGMNGAGSGSGVDNYQNHNEDNGTITVDVLREQPDQGLVISLSESGTTGHITPSTACVVYSNGSVICDPNATVYPEAYTVLRFLGAKFVDPVALDAHNHWQVTNNGPNYSAVNDFTIVANDGANLAIDEKRHVSFMGSASGSGNIVGTIHYNTTRQVPLAIEEHQQTQSSDGSHERSMTTNVSATLMSDSMATH